VDAGVTVTDDKVAVVTDNKDVLAFPPKVAVMTVVPLIKPVAKPVEETTLPTSLTPEVQTANLLTSRVDPSL